MKYLFIIALLWPVAASAHPHAFIDTQTTLLYDAQHRLSAVREHWAFDQFYTEFALHDFGYEKGAPLNHDKLLELARENLKNLRDFQYFTYFENKAVKLGEARDIDAGLEANRVTMTFTVPLTVPLDLDAKAPVQLRVYDQSYYTAMLQAEHVPLQADGAPPPGCTATLIRPAPALAWKTLAEALDRNATAPDNLGIYFAETVKVSCS